MSKRKETVLGVIEALLDGAGSISAGAVADAAGVTRQAAHYHLKRMVAQGELVRSGAGRGSRYSRVFDVRRSYERDGLREDAVWRDLVAALPDLGDAGPASSATRYALTEMVNNAIEHSGGTIVHVAAARRDRWRLRVSDDGVGVFRHFATRLGLGDDVAAAFELTKGKRTTAPAAHSGEGIFFTSRLVDRFGLEANGLALVVENDVGDFAIRGSPVVIGTTVWWEIDPATAREPAEVFDRFTDEDLRFTRTTVPLRAFGGSRMISRAEAKRVSDELERFDEATIDFAGVEEVGLAFIDELFRVWASMHPETRLHAVGMTPVVDRVFRRVLGGGPP